MRVRFIFEGSDVVPPLLFDQCRRAVINALDAFGLSIKVETDRAQEAEAFQRFFEWNAKRLADEFPKTPAESEVK